MAEVPEYEVRRGIHRGRRPGQWLGRTDLATSLNARFTAVGHAPALETACGHESSWICCRPPSTRPRLDGGRADLSVERGVLAGELRARGEDAEVIARLAELWASSRGSGPTEPCGSSISRAGRATLEPTAGWKGKFGLEAVADSGGLSSVGGTVTGVGGMGESSSPAAPPGSAAHSRQARARHLILRSNVATLDAPAGSRFAGTAAVTPCASSGRTRDLAPLAELAGLDSISLDSTRLAVGRGRPGPPLAGAEAARRPGASSTAATSREHLVCAPPPRWIPPLAAARSPISGRRRRRGQESPSSRRASPGRYDSVVSSRAMPRWATAT
jgi:hypothetical protein